MRLSFCCSEFCEERVKFAKEVGFEALEIFAGRGFPIDPGTIKDDEIKRAREILDGHGIAATVIHVDNYAEDKGAVEDFPRVLDVCEALGTDIVTCNAWVIEGDLAARIKFFKETFGGFAKQAEDKGMKIGIENCPHELNNIAYSPEMWEIIFNEIPSKALGLEFDPSHLCWMGIDYVKGIYDFAERIYAFHAKDTEVMKDRLKRAGILQGLSEGSLWKMNWWRYRLPGYGEVEWKRVFIALADIGYDGDISIEHEDPVFGGERTDEGLKRGYKFLRQFI